MEKLKVFISGTQADMQPEREVVSRAIDSVALTTGISAEKTLSRPEPPRQWIEQQIKDANIYLGIYGHRYGWVIPEEGISATEFEFNLARHTGKPILIWIRKLRDAERSLPNFERQQQFLMSVTEFSRGYMRQEFVNPSELESWVADALRETLIEIVARETTRPAPSRSLIPPTLVDAYLTEVANQKPYAVWSDDNYIERSVAKESDPFSRTVTRYESQAPKGERHHASEPLESALVREGKLVLLGEPGLGKTTSLLHLEWVTANHLLGSSNLPPGPDAEIPIYVELKYYNGEAELETLLAQRVNHVLHARSLLLAADLAESARILKGWMAQTPTRFLILLDGLNEVRPELYTAVRGLIHGILNSRHRVVIACRERDYDHSLRKQALAFVLERLQESNIRSYLSQILGPKPTHSLYDQILKDSKMSTLAGNPLMLWLIGTIARANPDVRLPSNRGELFRQFVGLMPRLRASEGLPASVTFDIVMSGLAKLALEMQRAGRTTVDVGELRDWQIPLAHKQLEEVLAQAKDWRFLKADGRMGEPVEFLHQLFLEYFAAAHLNAELQKGRSYEEVLGGRVLSYDLEMMHRDLKSRQIKAKLKQLLGKQSYEEQPEERFSYNWDEVILMLAGINNHPVEMVTWLSEHLVNSNIKDEDVRFRTALLIRRCWQTTRAVNDPEVRAAVIEAFIPRTLALIYSQSAMACLAEFGVEAIEPIIAALLTKRTGIGVSAALKKIGQAAIEPLIAALGREGATTGITFALIRIGPPAVEALVAAMRDKRVSAKATVALERIGAPAVEPLIAALKDDDKRVRSLAALALGEIGDPRALPALKRILREGKHRESESKLVGLAQKAADKIRERQRKK